MPGMPNTHMPRNMPQRQQYGKDSEEVKELDGESQLTKVWGTVTRFKMPVVLLLLLAYGAYIFVQHRKTETQAWEELTKLKAQLMEASSVRQEGAKVQNKLTLMLKDIADFRQALEEQQKNLFGYQDAVDGMESKTSMFAKQIESCPDEIRSTLSELEAKVVGPGGYQSKAQTGFEEQYMPLLWKASDELKSRINQAAPEDISGLRNQVDMLKQLLQDTSSKIAKVDTSEYADREAKVTALEAEIKRLGGEVPADQPGAFTALSEKRLSALELTRARVQTKVSTKSAAELHITGAPLKCMQQS